MSSNEDIINSIFKTPPDVFDAIVKAIEQWSGKPWTPDPVTGKQFRVTLNPVKTYTLDDIPAIIESLEKSKLSEDKYASMSKEDQDRHNISKCLKSFNSWFDGFDFSDDHQFQHSFSSSIWTHVKVLQEYLNLNCRENKKYNSSRIKSHNDLKTILRSHSKIIPRLYLYDVDIYNTKFEDPLERELVYNARLPWEMEILTDSYLY